MKTKYLNCPLPEDKENLLLILVSIELILERTKGYSYERHMKDWLLSDSVMYRVDMLGYLYDRLSEYTKNVFEDEKDPSKTILSLIFKLLKMDGGIPYDVVFNEFIKGKFTEDSESMGFGTFEEIYQTVERVYLKLFEPEEYQKNLKKKEPKVKQSTDLCTDYPYSTKTSNSIWTVKNK